MSKVVARALEVLKEHNCGVYIGGGHREIGDRLLEHIRAVDAQYSEGYDDGGGFSAMYSVRKIPRYYWCGDCFGERGAGHKPDCDRWNTRVALLNLCRDILGEKGCS